MNDDDALRVTALVAGYGEIVILEGIDLTLRRGTLTTIIGANGAGKSTLVRAIAGTLGSRAGSIRFEGRDVTALGAVERLSRGIGFVPQGRCNFPRLTVGENLRLGAFTRRDRAGIASDLDALLDRFPILSERMRTLAGNLSGGEQQILETAMVLMARPRLLLLDEPSLGLSPKTTEVVFREARRLADDGFTVLMVEQNAVAALKHSDAGIVMELGRIRHMDRADRVLAHAEIRSMILGI